VALGQGLWCEAVILRCGLQLHHDAKTNSMCWHVHMCGHDRETCTKEALQSS